MYLNLESLVGYRIQASDGEIGKVEQFLIDDEKWAIRYMVVATGRFLNRKKVLISPISIRGISNEHVEVSLTKEQIENSPDIDAENPVSRRSEIAYFQYYRWPYYWTGAGLWGVAPTPMGLTQREVSALPASPELQTQPYGTPSEDISRSKEPECHLYAHKELRGYTIESTDSHFGHVEDFIVDTHHWAIRYLVIDTVNFWPSKSVLISPQWIHSISWQQKKIRVDLDEETIKSSPSFDQIESITHEYEQQLHEHYGRPGHWQRYSDKDRESA